MGALLVGASVCENDANRLFNKMANFSDNDNTVYLSKGTKLQIFEDENIGSIDYTNLSWDSKVYLVYLYGPLRSEVHDFLNKNSDIFASSVLELPSSDTLKHEIRLKDKTPVKCKPYYVAL